MSERCRHCGRTITQDSEGRWIDPEATGDDSIWRETCDSHDTVTAEHEPAVVCYVPADCRYCRRYGQACGRPH